MVQQFKSMKCIRGCMIFVLTLLTLTTAFAQNLERNYLITEYQKKGEAGSLSINEWRKSKLESLYKKISNLPDAEKKEILAAADAALQKTGHPFGLLIFLSIKAKAILLHIIPQAVNVVFI